MQNARLEESQVGIKNVGRNNNLRYADDITLMAGSEEDLKSFLMRVKEESENGLNSTSKASVIKASGPIISWQIDGEKVQKVTDFVDTDMGINKHRYKHLYWNRKW